MARFGISALVTAILVAVPLALSGCTGYAPAPPAFSARTMQPYRLDAGDELRITVFDQDGLTGTYDVDQSGYVSFPLIGAVAARGKTAAQLEAAIAASLKKGYVRNPDVTVQVARYRAIFIMGEVGQAGQYSYVPGMTVQNAIAAAGGFSSRANQVNVDVTRKINGKVLTGRVPITDPVLAGDTIYVRERLF